MSWHVAGPGVLRLGLDSMMIMSSHWHVLVLHTTGRRCGRPPPLLQLLLLSLLPLSVPLPLLPSPPLLLLFKPFRTSWQQKQAAAAAAEAGSSSSRSKIK